MAPMLTARGFVGTAVLDGKLYAAGDNSEDGATLNLVERYDFATNAWEAVTPMATARNSHAMAVLDGKLYAVEGYSDDGDYLRWSGGASVERYDPATNAWGEVAPMGKGWPRCGGARRQAVRCGR